MNDGAQVVRQRSNRVRERIAQFEPAESAGREGVFGKLFSFALDAPRVAPAAAQAIDGVGAVDRAQPGAEALLRQLLAVARGGDEGLLHRIFGVFTVAENRQRLPDQLRSELFEQFPERIRWRVQVAAP